MLFPEPHLSSSTPDFDQVAPYPQSVAKYGKEKPDIDVSCEYIYIYIGDRGGIRSNGGQYFSMSKTSVHWDYDVESKPILFIHESHVVAKEFV